MLSFLLLRLFLPQAVGVGVFAVVSRLAARRALLPRLAAVFSSSAVAWLIAMNAWGGKELISGIFILAFVAGHALVATFLQALLAAAREAIA